jgi:cytochrome c556
MRIAIGFLRVWVLGASVAVTTVVIAATMTPRQAVEARQSNFKDMGGAFKAIRDQLRRGTPDLVAVQLAAQQMKDYADQQHTWFPKGSGPEAGVKTDAKKEIWTDVVGFVEVQKVFAAEAPKLLVLANEKNVDGLKAQVLVVGKSCKGCHDKYRVPEED